MSELKNLQGPAPDNDILSHSISALQIEGDAQGPSIEVHQRVLAALNRPTPKPNAFINFTQRTLQMVRVHKTAAAVTMTGSGLLVWTMLALLNSLSGISYGQVAEHIRMARTMRYTSTMTLAGTPLPIITKMFLKEPDHMRCEGPGQLVTIGDTVGGASLMLIPETKVALLVTPQDMPAGGSGMFGGEASGFRKLGDVQGKPIDDREIGGIKAKGFEAPLWGRTASVWAHPKTGFPLLIEVTMNVAGKEAKIVITDIAFDQPMDDALFSLTPPAGYRLQASSLKVVKPASVEDAVIEILRGYSEKANGRFPKNLDDWGDFSVFLSRDSKDGTLDAATQQILGNVGALTAMLYDKEKGKDYDYTPGGAKLGDNRIVFWIRSKDKADKVSFRAVFGDLTIKEVKEKELPGK